MPDEFTFQRSKRLTELYARFRQELDSSAVGGCFMPYSWWTLPDPLPVAWLAYSLMLQEYASELANIINDLAHHVHRLRGPRSQLLYRTTRSLKLRMNLLVCWAQSHLATPMQSSRVLRMRQGTSVTKQTEPRAQRPGKTISR